MQRQEWRQDDAVKISGWRCEWAIGWQWDQIHVDSDDDVKTASGMERAIGGWQDWRHIGFNNDVKMALGWERAIGRWQDWRHMALDDNVKMALGWGKAIVGWQEWDTWLWMTMWRWPQAGGGNEWLVDRHWWPMFQVDSIWHSFSFFRWKGSSLASDPLIIGTLTVTCLGCPFVWCTVVPQSLVNEFFYGPRTLELNKFMELFLDLENFVLVNSWVTLWTNLINNKCHLICILVQ